MISVVHLGLVGYADGLRLQQKLVDLRKSSQIGDVLLLLEHTPVITLGRNAKACHLLAPPETLAARGVEVFECDRGGDVTFHGPEQIVGYPIFDLREFERSSQFSVPGPQKTSSKLQGVSFQQEQDQAAAGNTTRKTLGVVDYVRSLEEVLIRTCGDLGIPTKRVAGLTGVWTETESSGKIAAIGVHISRSVTSHGFALNVNTDLRYFDLIVPCGLSGKPVTSMEKELGHGADVERVTHSLSRNFGTVFGRQMLWVESLETLLGQTVGVPMKVPRELPEIHGEDETAWA